MSEARRTLGLNPSIEDVAADWLARELSGKMSAAETAARDAWLAEDPAHQAAFAEARAAYDVSAAAASHADMLALRDAALQSGPAKHDRTRWIAPAIMAAVAASVLLAIGLMWRAPTDVAPGDRGVVSAENTSAPAPAAAMRDHYSTRIGERLTATLDDGSVITLNTNSEVRVRYSQASRRIELVKGQALFQVAHRADWPFLVEANGQAVRALGTEFEVRLNGGALEVVLVQGRVAVGNVHQLERGELDQAAELEAGERLVTANSVTQIAAVNADTATSWRRGRVSFGNTPLADAVAEINRYRTSPLVIRDPRLDRLTISGTYRTSDAMSFEDTLAGALAIDHVAGANGQVDLVLREGDAH